MQKARKPAAFVEVDIGARDLGPLNIHIWELTEHDLKVVKQRRPDRLKAIIEGGKNETKKNAQMVQETVDLLKPHERQDYERRKKEIEELADSIAAARAKYRHAGLPVIYSQGHNPLEHGKPTRLHRKLRLESVDKHIRLKQEEDYAKLAKEVEKRIEPGGEVTVSGGYFVNCVAQAAATIAAAGFKVAVPENLTDAKMVRQRGDPAEGARMEGEFQKTAEKTMLSLWATGRLAKGEVIEIRRTESDGRITWHMSKKKSPTLEAFMTAFEDILHRKK